MASIKLGTQNENTPHGNVFDATDLAKQLNEEKPKEKDKE